ncbi:DUF2283 domain-containing protein [Methanobrevibacter sp. DSM 116169]|uniref:DUF2283 domain-containing protein n=1 Tax=Methanobrevibacter sp. DSM 116169 TaxID=3242727 RepID=UPI0038FBF84B
MNQKIKVKSMYDYHFDILGIKVVNNYNYKESVELSEGIILDFDDNGVPVALEVLDASKVFGIQEKQYLSNRRQINMNIEITSTNISLDLKIIYQKHNNKKTSTVNYLTLNDINAPVMNEELATV